MEARVGTVTRLLRRLLPAAVALSALAAGVTPAFADHLPVDSDPDTTAPVLESFAISPTSVDVRNGSTATITATARITDDKSGVAQVLVVYRSPSGANRIFISFSPGNRTSGTEHVGDYSTQITIDPNRESGTWTVESVSTRDVVGNTRSYTEAEARALGAVDFTVLSNRDATPPRISAVRVIPNLLDVSGSNGFARFEWDATDEGGSGVAAATIALGSPPDGRQLMQAQGSISTSGVNAVTLTGDAFTRTFTPNAGFSELGLSQYSTPGVWTVFYVQVYDRANNVTTYQGAELAALLGPTPFFEVRSNPTDLLEPTVTAFRFSPASIDVSSAPATVSVEFDVADELSGVQAAWLTFRSPTIAASPPYIQRTATFYEDMIYPRITTQKTVRAQVTFPRYDRGGDWTVAEVCVMDRVKRKRCYTGEALKILGPTEITVISNTLTLTPPAEENPVGSPHTVTATLASQTGPISGAAILFSVAGANSASGMGTTDSSGRATFTYTGVNTGGDTITACHDRNTNGVCETAELKATATKTWVRPTGPTTLVLTPPSATNNVGEEHCVTAAAKDAAGAPTPNVKVVFSVSGANTAGGTVTTNASGEALFCYTGTQAGGDTISAFADTDGSGAQNDAEPTGMATKTYVIPDRDRDGVPDPTDNCPDTPNPGQENNDGDAQGDVCDGDDDNDTHGDPNDNCPKTANPDQADGDLDGIGDACDDTFNSTPCKVTGTGYTGSMTSFNLGAEYFAGAVAGIGSATYTDKSVSKTFRSTKITGVACKGSRATVEGTGTVNSTKSVTFRIVVDDRGAGAGTDTYAISWSGADTYAAPARTLTKGNLIVTLK